MASSNSNATMLKSIERIRNLTDYEHFWTENDLKTIEKILLKNFDEKQRTENKSPSLDDEHKKEEDDDFEVLISPSQSNVAFSPVRSSGKEISTTEKEEPKVVPVIENEKTDLKRMNEETFSPKEKMMTHIETTSEELKRNVLLKDAAEELGNKRKEVEKEKEPPSEEDEENELRKELKSVNEQLIETESKKKLLETESLKLYLGMANKNERDAKEFIKNLDKDHRTIEELMSILDESHSLMQMMINKIKLLQKKLKSPIYRFNEIQ